MRWRGIIFGLLLALPFWLVIVGVACAQSERTVCYKSGRDTICRTTTEYGTTVQETRCYKSGNDTICDTRR
jgi:hypothetical protein